MSLVKNVASVEEYNAAIAREGLGKFQRELIQTVGLFGSVMTRQPNIWKHNP